MVVTRFAPSPTGFLHIGGARTALFNWLYARRHEGKFLLRVEDTDKKRSTEDAKGAILDGLKWLGLDWDDEVIYQSHRQSRHQEIVQTLLDSGHAYYCYCSKEELDDMRATAQQEKRSFIYPEIWRDRDPSEAPDDIKPVVRLKSQQEGQLTIDDRVQGPVTVDCQTLDDMVLLRADGTPTYMLAVVVDDFDMGVTHIIRGDDHFTNSFRQVMIYNALAWDVPTFAHIPLIHGPDGAKMSKRHGALGVDAYKDMGYLPEAMRNYLLRLGWSHGDDEIISTKQMIEWFDLEHIGKSPARFDFDKLDHVNSYYLKECSNEVLIGVVSDALGVSQAEQGPEIIRLGMLMDDLKCNIKTLNELIDKSKFIINLPETYTDKAQTQLNEEGKNILQKLKGSLSDLKQWESDSIEDMIRSFAQENDYKLGQVMMPLRAALTGSHQSPSMFHVLTAFGKEESCHRLDRAMT